MIWGSDSLTNRAATTGKINIISDDEREIKLTKVEGGVNTEKNYRKYMRNSGQ